MNIMERIRSRVKVNEETGCWEWQGALIGNGYGQIRYGGRKNHRVHRLVFFLTNPEADKSLDVLHRCDNPPCCNPDHLFLGTHLDNMRDRDAKGRGMKPKGELNGFAKLTADKVREIRVMCSRGVMQKEIASLFNVAESTVSEVKTGQRWKHVE